jgi:hypothetical protein
MGVHLCGLGRPGRCIPVVRREAILGRPPTDYSSTKRALEDFEPFCQFWTTASDWKVRMQVSRRHNPLPAQQQTRQATP